MYCTWEGGAHSSIVPLCSQLFSHRTSGNPGGTKQALWWYIYVPRPRPPVHISTVVLELIHSMPKGRSKALLFIPYRSSARSGLGSFFKLENAQTFRSEALLEPVLESHPRPGSTSSPRSSPPTTTHNQADRSARLSASVYERSVCTIFDRWYMYEYS